MRRIPSIGVIGPMLFASVSGAFAANTPPTRPNFLLVFLDDMRYDAMSCAGHPFAQTPNMDRLAREGAYCQNAFVTISLCSPSRACFLTGQYAHRHGVMRNNGTDLREDAVTWPKELQKAGYQTAYFGKLHMAPKDDKRPGFDYWVSYKGQGRYFDQLMNIDGRHEETKGYIDDVVTDLAIEWVTKRRDRSRPFGMVLAFKSVHGPFKPPERLKDLYADAKVTPPVSATEPFSNKPAFVEEWVGRLNQVLRLDDAPFIRQYHAAVRGSDDNLGRMLDALTAEGILDDTCIVFSSDNGYHHREHGGLLDKRTAYEESIRIPMLVRYPKLVKTGTKLPQLVLHIDIGPTFLELAGVKVPGVMQGRSLVPVLTGKAENWRRTFLYEYFREMGFRQVPTIQAVRTERFKYIRYLDPPDRPELYDLLNDPHELKNLHEDPRQKDVRAALQAELDRLIEETGADKPVASKPE